MLYTLFALGIIYVLGKMLGGPNKRQPKMSTRSKEAAGNRKAVATTKTRATTAKKSASAKKPGSHAKPAAHRKDNTEPPPPKQHRQEEEAQDPLPDLDQRAAASVLKTLQQAGLIPTKQLSEANEDLSFRWNMNKHLYLQIFLWFLHLISHLPHFVRG